MTVHPSGACRAPGSTMFVSGFTLIATRLKWPGVVDASGTCAAVDALTALAVTLAPAPTCPISGGAVGGRCPGRSDARGTRGTPPPPGVAAVLLSTRARRVNTLSMSLRNAADSVGDPVDESIAGNSPYTSYSTFSRWQSQFPPSSSESSTTYAP